MSSRLVSILTPLALVGTAAPVAAAVTTPAHTKKQAEINVLRVVAQKFGARRLPGLVNPRTHLLADNTEAVCYGRGKRHRASGIHGSSASFDRTSTPPARVCS